MDKQDVHEIKIVDNENHPKLNMVERIVKLTCSLLTAIVAVFGVFVTIPNVINNSNQQKQTQVVIEPREGDIIVKDGDDYKLLQLINNEDVFFPTKVQEVQYKAVNSEISKRVDINNNTGENWNDRDSFVYIVNNFSINANKVINLLENIESIKVYCDFYTEKNISSFVNLGEKSFAFDMRSSLDEKDFEVTKTNIKSKYEYVTKEGLNDGIEWVKIRVEIVYSISEKQIKDTITSDWIETSQDYFG